MIQNFIESNLETLQTLNVSASPVLQGMIHPTTCPALSNFGGIICNHALIKGYMRLKAGALIVTLDYLLMLLHCFYEELFYLFIIIFFY